MIITGPDPAPLAKASSLGQALSAAGIRFAHWKSNGHLAQALSGDTDIDLFADPAQRQELRALLRREDCLEIISRPWSRYPDVEDWLAFDAETGRFLHLHLHFALVTGLRRVKHMRLPWGEILLANAVRDLNPDWPTPSAEMELLVLLVRIWAKMPPWRRLVSPSLPAHVRRELDWLRARASRQKLEVLAAELFPGVSTPDITALLNDPPPTDERVMALAHRCYRSLSPARRMPWPLALLQATRLNLQAGVAKRLRKVRPATVTGKTIAGPGLVIAFVGSDGAGKSTVTREIRKWLRYKLDVHGYYMGSGQGSTRLMDRLRHAFKSKTRKVKPAGDRKPKPPPGFFGKLAALHQLSAIHAKVRALGEARRLAAQGSVIVLDRFPQAQFPGIYDGPRLQHGQSFAWAARAERAAFDRVAELAPQLIVKLLITPETGHARKPDHSFETIRRKALITAELAFPNSHVVSIDASQPLDQVLLQAKSAVWQALRAAAAGHKP